MGDLGGLLGVLSESCFCSLVKKFYNLTPKNHKIQKIHKNGNFQSGNPTITKHIKKLEEKNLENFGKAHAIIQSPKIENGMKKVAR